MSGSRPGASPSRSCGPRSQRTTRRPQPTQAKTAPNLKVSLDTPTNSPPPLPLKIQCSPIPPAETLLLIDTLNPLATTHPRHLTPFLTTLLTASPLTPLSLVAVYHADVPLPLPLGLGLGPPPSAAAGPHHHHHHHHSNIMGEHEPHPATVLNHLATAVLRAASLPHAAARRRARDRSLPEPAFGLDEGREGVLVGLKGAAAAASSSSSSSPSSSSSGGAVVVEMELRRRSGRAVVERFVLEPAPTSPAGAASTGALSLLSDHPAFATPDAGVGGSEGGGGADAEEELAETTFSLGLTDKQRRDREGVVLPYFDAQEDVGGGEGGRILYDMGREDDFDDEEDEI